MVRAVNVGRQGNVPDALDFSEEIGHGKKPDAALSEAAAGDYLPLEFIFFPEEQSFSHSNFPSRTHQAFPFIWRWGKLMGEENFDSAAQEIARSWISGA